MLATGDLSERACAAISRALAWRPSVASFRPRRWRPASPTACPPCSTRPTSAGPARGDAFMAEFGAAMTGLAPKTTFLRPNIAFPLVAELVRQLLRGSRRSEERYAACLAADPARETSFANACLLETGQLAGGPARC